MNSLKREVPYYILVSMMACQLFLIIITRMSDMKIPNDDDDDDDDDDDGKEWKKD